MCMKIDEMNETMESIQEWKRIKEQAEDNISALNMKVIEFLNETEECEAVDKKEVKKLLSSEDYQKVSKISVYPVLRIS